MARDTALRESLRKPCAKALESARRIVCPKAAKAAKVATFWEAESRESGRPFIYMWLPRVGTCRALQGYDDGTRGTDPRPNTPLPVG
eukprot:5276277-Prymnesium_polylepis.1